MSSTYKQYRILSDHISYSSSGKSIGLEVCKPDGILLSGYVWFPLSQCIIKDVGNNVTLVYIPTWLVNSKIGLTNKIVELEGGHADDSM